MLWILYFVMDFMIKPLNMIPFNPIIPFKNLLQTRKFSTRPIFHSLVDRGFGGWWTLHVPSFQPEIIGRCPARPIGSCWKFLTVTILQCTCQQLSCGCFIRTYPQRHVGSNDWLVMDSTCQNNNYQVRWIKWLLALWILNAAESIDTVCKYHGVYRVTI